MKRVICSLDNDLPAGGRPIEQICLVLTAFCKALRHVFILLLFLSSFVLGFGIIPSFPAGAQPSVKLWPLHNGPCGNC
jgi:hypothetical protein